MTITAYTTQNIGAENLASAVAVMDAMRNSGASFPANFGAQKAIQRATEKQEGLAFTADMAGLAQDTEIEVFRGKSHSVSITLTAGEKMDVALAKAVTSKTAAAQTKNNDRSPKK